MLLFETPPKATLVPTRYPAAEVHEAAENIQQWQDFTNFLRRQTDHLILTSDRGATTRSVLYLSEAAIDRVHEILGALVEMATTSSDISIYERIGEQVIRLAGTLQVAEESMTIGHRVGLDTAYLDMAYEIAQYHWQVRQRIAGKTLAQDIDEACASIANLAVLWQKGKAPAGKRGFDPESTTWGWATLLQSAKHTGQRGRYAHDTEFKIRCRNRLIDCGIMAEQGRRVIFNPEYVVETYIPVRRRIGKPAGMDGGHRNRVGRRRRRRGRCGQRRRLHAGHTQRRRLHRRDAQLPVQPALRQQVGGNRRVHQGLDGGLSLGRVVGDGAVHRVRRPGFLRLPRSP